MNKAIKIVGGLCLLVGLAGVPAKASILNNGLTYTMSAANLNTMNAQFNIHITGINAATDTEGGRYGVESFAFEGANLLTGETGTSANFSFTGGGLNSNGCNGNGNFFCFSAIVDPTAPALAANTTLDIAFSMSVTSGNFLAWAASDPHFKINWEGTKNNYDLLSVGGSGVGVNPLCTVNCDPTVTPIPGAVWLFGTVLAGGAGFGRWRKRRKAQLATTA